MAPTDSIIAPSKAKERADAKELLGEETTRNEAPRTDRDEQSASNRRRSIANANQSAKSVGFFLSTKVIVTFCFFFN